MEYAFGLLLLDSIHLVGLLEERLQRPIYPEVSEPGFTRVRLDPIAFFSSRSFWTKIEINASIAVGLKSLGSGGDVHDPGFVFENYALLDVVHGDRPKVGSRRIRFDPEAVIVFPHQGVIVGIIVGTEIA